jgi:hypothetical protein
MLKVGSCGRITEEFCGNSLVGIGREEEGIEKGWGEVV